MYMFNCNIEFAYVCVRVLLIAILASFFVTYCDFDIVTN